MLSCSVQTKKQAAIRSEYRISMCSMFDQPVKYTAVAADAGVCVAGSCTNA
jgi:hypothetical protein